MGDWLLVYQDRLYGPFKKDEDAFQVAYDDLGVVSFRPDTPNGGFEYEGDNEELNKIFNS